MNIERLKQLRDFLEELPEERFVYESYFDAYTRYKLFLEQGSLEELREDCGTCGCIAGWAYLLYGEDTQESRDKFDALPNKEASKLLDIRNRRISGELFLYEVNGKSKKHAIARINHLLEFGDFSTYNFDGELHEQDNS